MKKDIAIPDDFLVFLERTMCFGNCPVYGLKVDSKGKVIFKGWIWTKIKGIAEAHISEVKIKKIISEFEKADFFSLRDTYINQDDGCYELSTCAPSEIISIRLNGKRKTIHHDLGCVAGKPTDTIIKLCKRIDEITGSKNWVGKITASNAKNYFHDFDSEDYFNRADFFEEINL